jgi:hypothetical protein
MADKKPTPPPATVRRKISQDRQPLNTFFQQNVEPNALSTIRLSGGRDAPYYYSLGNQSTVPFVRLEGSGGSQKELTWGDSVEVLPNELVQVRNISYMPGDIQIQGGRLPSLPPARISISVQTDITTDNPSAWPGFFVRPVFPCDTRRARRAFLGCEILTAPESEASVFPTVDIYGMYQQHSMAGHPSNASISTAPSGKKYVSIYAPLPSTTTSMIPLGWGAVDAPDQSMPHTLADFVLWRIYPAASGTGGANNVVNPLFYYTLEYL